MTTNSNFATIPSSRSKLILKLVQRRLLSFYRDKTDLSITFLQAPVLAIAFFFVFQAVITVNIGASDLFQPLRNYLSPDSVSIIIFLVILTGIWFGTSKAIVEIPGSMILYQQERLSFLSSFDFILSIFIALSIIVFGQVLLFSITFHLIFVVLPAWINPYETGMIIAKSESISFFSGLMPGLFINFLVLMWLTAVASIAVAMFISTFFKTRSAANAVLPFLLIIQILVGGSIIKPIVDMNGVVHVIADSMVSRWGFEAAVLLFEKELNTSMPRFKDKNHNFFIGSQGFSLRKIDSSTYISVLEKKWDKKSVPEIVNKHPKIAHYWYQSLHSATSDNEIFPRQKLSKAESEYIDVLEEYNEALLNREDIQDEMNNNWYALSNHLSALQTKVTEVKPSSEEAEIITPEEDEFLKKHPKIAYYSSDSLCQAVGNFMSEKAYSVKSKEIKQLAKSCNKIPKLKKKQKTIDDTLRIELAKVQEETTPSVRFIEEAGKKFFAEDGDYAKAVNNVLSGTGTNLNELEQIILTDAISLYPRLKFFRPQHSQTTWLMLLLIIIVTFSLGWLNFVRRNR